MANRRPGTLHRNDFPRKTAFCSRLSIENRVAQAAYEVFLVGVGILFGRLPIRRIERPFLQWLRRRSQRFEPLQANALSQLRRQLRSSFWRSIV